MGIYINLKPILEPSIRSRTLARLHFSNEIIKYFEEWKYFSLSKFQIWLKAPSETLGGTLKEEQNITDTYETFEKLRERFTKTNIMDELFSSIVVFHGEWNFDGMKFHGFVSSNNSSDWRKTYHDIETDLYGREDINDLTEALLTKTDFENIVPDFVSHIRRAEKEQTMTASPIYFSIGAAEYGETDDLIALHLKDWRELIRFLYSKLRRSKDIWVKEQVTPFDKHFYLSSLTEVKIAETIFKQAREETNLIEKMGNSVTYIGRDRNSLTKFYERVKKEIFKTASRELPNSTILKQTMRDGLEGKKTPRF